MGMYRVNPGLSMHQGMNTIAVEGKGKGREREADFEAAFAEVAASLTSAQSETSRIVEVEEGITNLEDVVKSLSLNPAEGEEYGTDFKTSVEPLDRVISILMPSLGYGTTSKTQISHLPRKISRSGNPNSISLCPLNVTILSTIMARRCSRLGKAALETYKERTSELLA
jgi:hypothetical protein